MTRPLIHPTAARLMQAAREHLAIQRWVDLARRLRISEQTATNWKTRGVPANRMVEVAAAVGCRPQWLLDGRGNMRDERQTAVVAGNVPVILWRDTMQLAMGIKPQTQASLPCPAPHSDRTFGLIVEGVAMEPDFRDGEVIFVDPGRTPVHGDFVIAAPNGAAQLGRYLVTGEDTWLEATNPAWPNRIRSLNGTAPIGTVIFAGRRF